jgi:hypothetical protein
VYPLIELGTETTLDEKDVWLLSPDVRSWPVFVRWSDLPFLACLILDFSLSLLKADVQHLSFGRCCDAHEGRADVLWILDTDATTL